MKLGRVQAQNTHTLPMSLERSSGYCFSNSGKKMFLIVEVNTSENSEVPSVESVAVAVR